MGGASRRDGAAVTGGRAVLRPLTTRQRASIAATMLGKERSTNGGRPDPGLLAKGFFSQMRTLYPFGAHDHALFLTDWEIETRLIRLNPADRPRQLADKLSLHRHHADGHLPARMPELLGVWRNGALAEGRWRGEPAVIKPVDGSGGRGVRRIEGGEAPPATGTYLLEAPVAAHPRIDAIFPGALSTLRVGTMRDGDGAFVFGAAHRIATSASAPVDNRKRGGLVAGVDIEGGRLLPAIPSDGLRRRTLDAHPETGQPIAGVVLPGLAAASAAALDLMDAFPTLRHAGWDFALAADGPVLIEANVALPNPNLFQAHRPLLLDARVRCALLRAGVIRAHHVRAAERALGRRALHRPD